MPTKSAIVEIEVQADATDAIKDVGKAEAALQDLEKAAQAVGAGADGIGQLTEAMGGLQGATEDAAATGGGFAEAFKGGMAGGAIVAGISGLASVIQGAFTKLAETGVNAFMDAMDMSKSRDVLQAQLGLTAEQAETMGHLAGDLYSEAYGDSLGQVNEALKLVTQNVGLSADTQAQELQSVTGAVLNLATTFDQDLGQTTRAVGQMMKTGMAANATEALDILTVGFQKGNDKAEDLLDTMNEYGTTFRAVGVTGKVAMGLISQGLQAGARDADKVADAIKEFGIRSKDASQTSADAFKALGLDAKEMTRIFAQGGEGAAEGLDKVLDSLRAMEDPVAKNAAAVGLFGTQAEDLGDALFALDPSSAVAALGEVGGAAERMGQSLADNAQTRWETWKRTVQTNVITFIADNVIPALDSVAEVGDRAFRRTQEAWGALMRGFRREKGPQLGIEDGRLTSSLSAIEAMQPPEAQDDFLKQMADLGELLRQMADEWIPKLSQAFEDLKTKVGEVTQWLKDNKDAMEALKIFGVLVLVGAVVVLIGFLVALINVLVLVAIFVALLAAPFVALKKVMDRFGIDWSDLWRGAQFAVTLAWLWITGVIEDLKSVITGLVDLAWGLFLGDWSRAWDGAKRIVEGAVSLMLRPIRTAIDAITELLNLVDRIRGNEVVKAVGRVDFGGRAVGPSMTTLTAGSPTATSTASGAGSTVINVNVSHTGLGVDNPALQRDLVRTLKRYVAREGPIRVRTAT